MGFFPSGWGVAEGWLARPKSPSGPGTRLGRVLPPAKAGFLGGLTPSGSAAAAPRSR